MDRVVCSSSVTRMSVECIRAEDGVGIHLALGIPIGQPPHLRYILRLPRIPILILEDETHKQK